MALATTTTPGSIILGGDLTGVANAPELRITGVTAGNYSAATIVIDAKGRLIYSSSRGVPLLGEVTGYTSNSVLPATGVTAGSYLFTSTTTIDAKGRITSIVPVNTDATYTSKGIARILSDNALSITNGVLSGTVATNSTLGFVKTTGSITSTSGNIDISSSIPKINSVNTFSKSLFTPTLTVAAGTLTPDLSSSDSFVVPPGTSLTTPINYVNGQQFNIYGDNSLVATAMIEVPNVNNETGTSSRGIAWNGSFFVKVGAGSGGGGIQKSTDGINWVDANPLPNPVSSYLGMEIEYGGGVFLVTLSTSWNTPSQYGAWSSDGINWSVVVFPASAVWTAIAYGSGRFVLVNGADTTVVYSQTGVSNWLTTTAPIAAINIAHSTYFYSCRPGSISRSIDGITWESVSTSIGGMHIATLGDSVIVGGAPSGYPTDAATLYITNNGFSSYTQITTIGGYSFALQSIARTPIGFAGKYYWGAVIGSGIFLDVPAFITSSDYGVTWMSNGAVGGITMPWAFNGHNKLISVFEQSKFVLTSVSTNVGGTYKASQVSLGLPAPTYLTTSGDYKLSNTLDATKFILECTCVDSQFYCTFK